MKNVVAISLIIFLVPLAGCLDELSEPTKIELWEGEWHLAEGDFWRVGPAEGYGQFEWELTHIPTGNESSDFTWNVYLMNVTNFERYSGYLEDGNSPLFFVNGSWISMDGNGTKGPFNVDSSDGHYLIVENTWGNENDTLSIRIQFYGWK